MEYNVQFAKGKWLGTKDIDIWKIYIWVNWPTQLGMELFRWTNRPMKLIVWDTELVCFIWDSTQPFRGTSDDSTLVQLMVEVQPLVAWALLTGNLKLIIT